MEVYIDDMLVKSVKAELHITHLSEAFQILKSYNMKLNPAKCAFGVFVGKFLGFIVNSRGIEANPYKIKVVLDMLPPSNIKDIQRLRDAHYKEAFMALKTYLSSPPVLVSPSEGELLTLYLVVSDFSTSAALVRERDRVQQPVYYCSRALRGVEERYPKMEKLILALVTTSRKLRPYFQAHTVEVPTEYPMKQILHKPETSGRLIKWTIELSEFDIRYKPRTSVKGQILAGFIMEFTPTESTEATQLTPDLPI